MKKEKCVYCREYGNLPCEKCDKQDKNKIYLDLSKLSEEEIKEVISLLPEPALSDDYDIRGKYHYLLIALDYDSYCDKWYVDFCYDDKTEITLSEFRQLFSEGEEVLQVENKINIDELTKLCNEYNRSDLKISNLKRDLEYKKSWNEESFAIQEIKQQISILQKIKETAQSKLQDIGIEF